MNRSQYLNQLKQHLKGFTEEEIRDILFDYEEHFDIGISKGKTEEEISMELGDPKDIAQNFKNNSSSNNYNSDSYNDTEDDKTYRSNHGSRNILLMIMLMFFNVVLVLGPFIALAAILFSSYAVGISFIFAGFAILIGSPISVIITIAIPNMLTSVSFGIGFIALGIIGILVSVHLTKLFMKLTLRYLRWNMRVINGEEAI